MEVTRLYDLTKPGNYTVSTEIDGFNLTTKDNIANSYFVKYVDKTAVKQAKEVNSDAVTFVIIQ